MRRQTSGPERLRLYLIRKLDEKKFDTAEVEARARRLGWEIDQSYVSRIKGGKAGNVTVPKLQALAAGLDVSEDELFAVVRGVECPESYTSTEFYILHEKMNRLREPNHRKLVSDIISMTSRKADEYLAEEEASGPADVAASR